MYEAPEIIFDKSQDRRSDLWSLGMVLFELISGAPITNSQDSAHYLARVSNFLKSEAPKDIVGKSSQGQNEYEKYKEVVKLNVDWKREIRLAAPTSISQEKWNQFIDLMLSFLKWNPSERISLERALQHPFFVE
jgi:serine/threonine protein kinase